MSVFIDPRCASPVTRLHSTIHPEEEGKETAHRGPVSCAPPTHLPTYYLIQAVTPLSYCHAFQILIVYPLTLHIFTCIRSLAKSDGKDFRDGAVVPFE
jgi:hypothetical protein